MFGAYKIGFLEVAPRVEKTEVVIQCASKMQIPLVNAYAAKETKCWKKFTDNTESSTEMEYEK